MPLNLHRLAVNEHRRIVDVELEDKIMQRVLFVEETTSAISRQDLPAVP